MSKVLMVHWSVGLVQSITGVKGSRGMLTGCFGLVVRSSGAVSVVVIDGLKSSNVDEGLIV